MKVIAITGTPGTGKTTLAKKLAKRLGFVYVDVNKVISDYKISEGYDRKRKSRIVDIKRLNKALITEIKKLKRLPKTKGIVVDSHFSHYLPRKFVDLCIVAKCGLKELSKRLAEKGYGKNKIRENLQAEIFDICHMEALGMKHKMLIVNTAKGFNIAKIIRFLGG